MPCRASTPSEHRSGNIPSVACASKAINIPFPNDSVSSHISGQQQLPQLRDLYVAWSPLTVQTAAKLSEGNWPKLQSLGWSNCISGADALQQIAKGSWPMLVDLNICRCEQARCNYFQMQDFLLTDLDPLQTSQWPLLQRLSARGWNCIRLSDKSQQCRWPNLSSFSTSHVNAWGQLPSLQELSFHCITRSDSLLNALSLHLPTLKQLLACSLMMKHTAALMLHRR